MPDLRTRVRSHLEGSERYPWIVLSVALVGLISANFMVSVLGAVVDLLAMEFRTDESTMVWVVIGPNLGFAVLAVTAGKLADLYGRRPAFLVALIGSGLFGGLSAAAWSPGSLIAFRTISAVFGSATGPAGIAILSMQFDADRRIRVLGIWGLVMAGGPVLGIVVGGPIIDLFSWRWIFIAQVPLTLIALAAAYLVLPETPRAPDVRFDLLGTVLLASAVTIFLVGVNRGPVWGWSSVGVVSCLLATPVLAWLFVTQERRAPVPLIPIEYFRRRNFALPMVSQFLTNFSYMGAGFVLTPLFLASVLGYSATRTSYLVTSRPLFFGLAGPVVGIVGAWLGERRVAVIGASFVAVSAGCLALMGEIRSDAYIFLALGLAGFGLGFAMPAMTAAMTESVDPSDIAMAGGAQQMVWQLGTVTGIQVLLSIQIARADIVGVDRAFTEAFLIGGAVALFGVMAASGVRRIGAAPRVRRIAGPLVFQVVERPA